MVKNLILGTKIITNWMYILFSGQEWIPQKFNIFSNYECGVLIKSLCVTISNRDIVVDFINICRVHIFETYFFKFFC